MMQCATRFQQALKTHNELSKYVEVVGSPVMSVVAFASKPGQRNIYVVNDALSKKGWALSALQSPPALHMCFTPAHSMEITEALIRDLCDAYANTDDQDEDDGMAPLYGASPSMPPSSLVAPPFLPNINRLTHRHCDMPLFRRYGGQGSGQTHHWRVSHRLPGLAVGSLTCFTSTTSSLACRTQ